MPPVETDDEEVEATPEAEGRPSPAKLKAIARKALACWKSADASEAPQLAREREDIGFYAGGDFQWPDEVIASRKGRPAGDGLPAVPSRPRLTINKLRQPVRQLQNQERNAHLAAQLIPADDFGAGTSEEVEAEIEVREGLYRRIQRESEAMAAHSWAFDRVAQAGRGYWRVLIEPVSDRSFDHKVVIKRIYNQASVRLDPSHVEPDGSDARWALIAVDMSEEAYKDEFPDSNLDVASADEFSGLMSQAPGWFSTDDEGNKSIRVAEYFWTAYEEKTLCWLNGGPVWEEQVPKGIKPVGPPDPDTGRPTKPRKVSVPQIYWAKINGAAEVLDYQLWAGRYIPLIKEVGEELQPFDADRRVEGLVRQGISSQQGFNFMVSAMVEAIALAPKAPYIATQEQIEGYEAMYANAAILPLPYLLYNAVSNEGKPLDAPRRDVVEPAIQATAFGITTFAQSVHDTTGIPEASLGNVDPSIKSGRAILALQKQAQQATSNYLDNHARSIRYEAKIVNDLLYPVYGRREGRLVSIMTAEGEQDQRMIGQPGPVQGPIKRAKLTDREFAVAITVGKSYDTRNEEGAAALAETLGPNPGMFAAFADIWFKMQTWPGADVAAERAKLMLPPQIQAHEAQKDQDPRAQLQQMQGKLQQQGQMVDALTARVKEQQMAIEGETIKQAGDTERQRLKIESDERIASMKVHADLIKTQASINAKQADTMIKAEVERVLTALEDRHEILMSTIGHQQTLEQGQQAQEAQLASQSLDNPEASAQNEPVS